MERNSARAGLTGFTLLEMSMVIVVIAFLIGGIITGKSLIRNGELRAVVEESQTYIHAVDLFHEKYLGLPGDITNAEAIWGSAGSGSACFSAVSTGSTATCNGDGNGQIGYTTHSAELYRAWQQLANAGFVTGSYTGVDPGGSGTYTSVAGVNVPASKLKPGGWSFSYSPPTSGDTDIHYYNGNYGNVLSFSENNPGGSVILAILTPEEAMTIDQKTDDGHPATGNTLAFKSTWNPGCTTSDSSATAEYNVSGTRISACTLTFITNF